MYAPQQTVAFGLQKEPNGLTSFATWVACLCPSQVMKKACASSLDSQNLAPSAMGKHTFVATTIASGLAQAKVLLVWTV